MSGIIAFILLIGGAVMWCLAVASIWVGGIDASAVFYLILGAQLVRLGYAICDSEEKAKWHREIVDKLSEIDKRSRFGG